MGENPSKILRIWETTHLKFSPIFEKFPIFEVPSPCFYLFAPPLSCNVDPAYPEALIDKGKIRIDENFSNDQLEWVIHAETADPVFTTN